MLSEKSIVPKNYYQMTISVSQLRRGPMSLQSIILWCITPNYHLNLERILHRYNCDIQMITVIFHMLLMQLVNGMMSVRIMTLPLLDTTFLQGISLNWSGKMYHNSVMDMQKQIRPLLWSWSFTHGGILMALSNSMYGHAYVCRMYHSSQ